MRGVFRDWSSMIVLRDIDRIWQAEGFAPGWLTESIGGQRQTRWGEYEATVSWSDADHIRRVLRVYESVITEFPPDDLTRLTKVMKLDGWLVDENCRIVAIDGGPLRGLSGLDQIRGAEGIHEAFARVTRLLDDDPAGTVGAVKELIESTAKTVLESLHIEVPAGEDMPWLIKRTQTELGLAASTVREDVDSSQAVKKILGGLSGVVIGIVELRNAEGSGHGRSRGTRLTHRHARLALNGARAWCEIVLDTFADSHAPWRKRQAP
jgi:hypothetical protein